MVLNLTDAGILAAYTGFWKFTVKRHFKPAVFARLSEEKLSKYARVFKISPDELKQIPE